MSELTKFTVITDIGDYKDIYARDAEHAKRIVMNLTWGRAHICAISRG